MDSLKSPQIYESPKNFEELETLAIIWDTLGEQVRHIACDICGNDSRMCLESWSPCRPSGEETICFSYTTSCKGETDWDSDEFPAKYLWMSDEDAKMDWAERRERERQEEERRKKEQKVRDTAEQFRKDYERYQELKARFECVDKSVGTPEECCGTCGHKIWGAGPKDDGYLICTDKHEVRTRHSVCLDWVPEETK